MADKIKANVVMFDYGNTLMFDLFDAILLIVVPRVRNILHEAGYNVTEDVIRAEWSASNKTVSYKYLTHFAQEETIIHDWMERIGIKASDRICLAPLALVEYRKELMNEVRNSPYRAKTQRILEALKAKGKKLAVVSNNRDFDTRGNLELWGVDRYIDFIATSEKTGAEKPDPAMFNLVLDKLHETPENAVYVGDEPLRDIDAPKIIGMKAVLFIPPAQFRKTAGWRDYQYRTKYQPDAVIEDLEELGSLIL